MVEAQDRSNKSKLLRSLRSLFYIVYDDTKKMSSAILSYAGWAFLPGVCSYAMVLKTLKLTNVAHGSSSQDGYSLSTTALPFAQASPSLSQAVQDTRNIGEPYT